MTGTNKLDSWVSPNITVFPGDAEEKGRKKGRGKRPSKRKGEKSMKATRSVPRSWEGKDTSRPGTTQQLQTGAEARALLAAGRKKRAFLSDSHNSLTEKVSEKTVLLPTPQQGRVSFRTAMTHPPETP